MLKLPNLMPISYRLCKLCALGKIMRIMHFMRYIFTPEDSVFCDSCRYYVLGYPKGAISLIMHFMRIMKTFGLSDYQYDVPPIGGDQVPKNVFL